MTIAEYIDDIEKEKCKTRYEQLLRQGEVARPIKLYKRSTRTTRYELCR